MQGSPRATSRPSPSRLVALERRLAGPLLLRAGLVVILEVPDSRTGKPRQFRIVPIEVEGVRHVVSLYGVTGWVRSLRASGRAELLRKGVPEAVTAVEVFGDERDRVIAAYLAKIGWRRRDYDALPDTADHPTFRLQPIR